MLRFSTALAASLLATTCLAAACTTETASATPPAEADLTSASKLPWNPVTAQDGSITGGHCSATVPVLAKTGWRHKTKSTADALMGAPNHRIRDVIVLPGQTAKLRGRFAYGSIDKDLEDEVIELWVQKCPNWQLVGSGLTDGDGVVWLDVPALPAGDYRVRMIARGDGSFADGLVAVWPKGVQVVVSDIDGTLTTSDWELFKDVFGKKSAAMYADADKAIRTWTGKGYRVLYLTGRPQIYNRYSRNWLDTHNLPLGVVRLTDDVGDVVPSESGVQEFKTQVLKDLLASHAAVLKAGHGNAVTDIGAYQAAGIPNADLWIVGPHAGEQGSAKVVSYTKLLPTLAKYPAAKQP
ncbi:MAG: hypothetical protein HY902_18585 [Deltaproteobacteria bacterium]|nr:hypothetical protein [Deltaproteobacteria bacterium]